jgi:hypothetical protein
MNALRYRVSISLLALLAAGYTGFAGAQVPVDGSGEPLATYEPLDEGIPQGNEEIPLLTQTELQDLVGPVALYPDDLLAVVLPASTFPLQLVEAQRFLQALEDDPSLQPDEDWDDSIIAILNYPEVVDLLNEDLDWTWRLGEAVVAQQTDVVAAVESFRDRAYAAGNLRSDDHQTVAHNEGTIEITPVEDDVIYVPYYEPESVVVYQPRPVYYYYPRAYPVYYYPYPDSHAFNRGYFWGVTTAFTVGWLTDSVHVMHHSYHGHPYYGHHYWNGWWYRRPSVHVHNHYYTRSRQTVSTHRYSRGDYWRPRHEYRRRLDKQRITRSNYYADRGTRERTVSNRSTRTTRTTTARVRSTRQSRDATSTRRQQHTTGSTQNRRVNRPTSNRTAGRATTVAMNTPRRQQYSPPTRSSRQATSQRRETARPRETRPAPTRRHENRSNEPRTERRREAPAARQHQSHRSEQRPSRSAERPRGERKKQEAPDRRNRSRGTSAKRHRD